MAMFQGDWTCGNCGGSIKELPFQPRSNSGLTCRDCYFKEKDDGSGGGKGSSSGNGSKPVPEVDTGKAAELDDRDMPDFNPDDFGTAGEPAPESPEFADVPATKKKMFEGAWKCATCDGPITSLPFEPRDVTNLKCIDCFKKSKA